MYRDLFKHCSIKLSQPQKRVKMGKKLDKNWPKTPWTEWKYLINQQAQSINWLKNVLQHHGSPRFTVTFIREDNRATTAPLDIKSDQVTALVQPTNSLKYVGIFHKNNRNSASRIRDRAPRRAELPCPEREIILINFLYFQLEKNCEWKEKQKSNTDKFLIMS